jgi:hypothetical protein
MLSRNLNILFSVTYEDRLQTLSFRQFIAILRFSLALRLHSRGYAASSLANPNRTEWPHFNYRPQTNPLTSYPADSPRMCMAPRLRWRPKLRYATSATSSIHQCDGHPNCRNGSARKLADSDCDCLQHHRHQRDLECKRRDRRNHIAICQWLFSGKSFTKPTATAIPASCCISPSRWEMPPTAWQRDGCLRR